MRKGIKILGKVIASTILSFVILLVVAAAALQIPAVQNFVVQRVVRVVSDKLQTTVAVQRIAIVFPGKVRVRGFYVEDYQRDTLLYAGRVDAFVTRVGGKGVRLSYGELDDVKLFLRETPEGEMNIKQVVSRLSNPDRKKKKPFCLTIASAAIGNMELCLERQRHRNPPYGIDFGHMHLSDIAAEIERFELNGPVIETDIRAFGARERSGFVLRRLSGLFRLDNGSLDFTDAKLETDESRIALPRISLKGDSWVDYKDFVHRVQIEGTLRHSVLATDDVAYFSPGLYGKSLTLKDVDLDFSGTVADFDAEIRSLRMGQHTYLAADVSAQGLPDFKQTHFDAHISRLRTVSSDVQALVGAFARNPLSPKLIELLRNAGAVNLVARFKGTPSLFRTNVGAATDVGGMNLGLALQPLERGRRSIDGNVATRNLRLGQLLGRPDLFGDASLSARIDGVLGRGYADAQVDGEVVRLNFKDYTYDTLRLDGRLYNKQFDGRITARDPNLDFDFAGLVDFNDAIPRYDFSLALHRADLAQLHVNPRDSVSQLSARMVARASGRSLDDLNGNVWVTDGVYRYNDRTLKVDTVLLRGKNSANSKFVEMRSDFADVTFRSRTSYREVFAYLRQSAAKYLPQLNRNTDAHATVASERPAADNYSQLKVDIRDFNPIADAVSSGLQIAEGSSLNLTFNPSNDRLSLRAVSDYIERRDLLAIRLNLNARNTNDSLVVSADAENFYAAGLHLPGLHVSGGAKEGRVELSTGFADTTRRFSGLFGVRAEVSDPPASPNGQVLDVRILPSRIVRGDVTWRILARGIRVDTAQVVIDRFRVMSNGQDLLLDGVASRNPNDSLTLRLSNFDLAPFSQIVDRMGYGIEGRSNGEATMKAVLGGGEISADIRLDSLSVNGIMGPPLELTSRWDLARNRAGLFATNRITRDTLVRGFYAPNRGRYYAHMQVDSLDLGLLEPVLANTVSDVKGTAAVDVKLLGERRSAELTGSIRASQLRATVDFTQVTYTIPEAELSVNNNRFACSNVPFFDPEHNRGTLDLTLDLQHLSNIAYDVRVRPDAMLVLDTSEQDNDAFYGKVYATGNARISGDKGKVAMRITAATDDHSSFFLPMSSKSNISNADFVVFERPQLEDTTDLLVLKRQQFEKRRMRRAGTTNQMDISMTLDVRPNVELELSVSGNVIRARGTGTLSMQINPKSNVFEMYGDYTIDDGSFHFSLQNILNRKFDIEPGSTIQWTGSPVNALLNIDAIYKLKASLQPLLGSSTTDRTSGDRSVNVECLIHLDDRLTDPTVTFDVRVPATDPETQAIIANALSAPETVDMQFLYLLLFKSFMAENSAVSQNIGASVSYNTGLEFLTNQLSNLLSADDYSIVIRYRPKSELTGDEVDFGLSKGLINNRLFVELEGNYLIDNKQQMVNRSMSNFMGEAYITYLIDRAGTLKLKAFTQTIDRFDENQGLQETGLGIYFKEDFDNFRDFRQRVRERFTNKKRQARRAAKKAEQLKAKQEEPTDAIDGEE